MFDLAQTAWPRFGGDRANRSLLSISGPHTPPLWRKIALPILDVPSNHMKRTYDGVIVMPDETLRVCHAGLLIAVTMGGAILWQIDLCSLVAEDTYWVSSLPTALQTGETLLHLSDALLLVDRSGNIRKLHYPITFNGGHSPAPEPISPDDSGFSPNLTYSGLLILTAITGEVYLCQEHEWQEIGEYGYDIVTPAVYPDNSLAITGFARKGFCRVNPDGEIRWATRLKDADLRPVLNQEHIAVVGSLNDQCSVIFTPDGEQIGEYHHAAQFAVYPDGGWIALSKQRLARLTLEGKELWAREMSPVETLSLAQQPIVDKDGFIFVRQVDGFLCCDADGHTVFEVTLPLPPQGFMSIVAPGVMAYAQENELFLGYS